MSLTNYFGLLFSVGWLDVSLLLDVLSVSNKVPDDLLHNVIHEGAEWIQYTLGSAPKSGAPSCLLELPNEEALAPSFSVLCGALCHPSPSEVEDSILSLKDSGQGHLLLD